MFTGHTEDRSKMTRGLRYREFMSLTGAWVGGGSGGKSCGTFRCIFFKKNLRLVASQQKENYSNWYIFIKIILYFGFA